MDDTAFAGGRVCQAGMLAWQIKHSRLAYSNPGREIDHLPCRPVQGEFGVGTSGNGARKPTCFAGDRPSFFTRERVVTTATLAEDGLFVLTLPGTETAAWPAGAAR